MRCTHIAATLVAAGALAACTTVNTAFETMTSFLDGTEPAPLASNRVQGESASVGRVVAIETVRPLGGEEEKSVTPGSDFIVDVRADNGDLRTVIQPLPDGLRIGDRVRLAEGRAYRY